MIVRISDKKKNYSKVTKLLVKPYIIFFRIFGERVINQIRLT